MHRFPWINISAVIAAVAALGLIAVKNADGNGPAELLNVSYDPTRELYQHINAQFAAHHKNADGKSIAVRQSHGGSSYQARLLTSGELRPTWSRSNT
jgi:sulfate transport system substrate-binding protein